MKEKFSGGSNLGGLTILVIFTVLCLTVFCVLSLASARADSRLQGQSVVLTQQYYKADGAAEEKRGEVYQTLRTASAAAKDEAAYWEKAAAELGGGFDPETRRYAYQIPINENLELRAVLQLTAEPSCDAVEWVTVTTVEYEPDNTVSVWQDDSETN